MAPRDLVWVSGRHEAVLVNQYVALVGMEQPALFKHVGSTALRVAVARLRNSPCPSANRDTAQTVLAVRRLPPLPV